MKKILIIAGAVFIIYGTFLFVLSNLNLGTFMTGGIGGFLLLLGVFFDKIKAVTQKGIMRAVKQIVLALICAEAVLVGFIAVYGRYDNVDYSEDAIIVLGAGIHGEYVSWPLMERLETAVKYHERNPDALIVVTGGQGFQETITEALAMERYLVGRGVSADRIIKEEKATSTNENMRFSKELLDVRFDSGYKIAVVTNNFHIYRGTAIAKAEGLKNVSHIHAKLQWYNIIPCYLRESLAVIKLWVLG